MIYWHLQWHPYTHRFIAGFYCALTLMTLNLSLPVSLHGLTCLILWLAYRDICEIVKQKPLALIYNGPGWSAISRKGHIKLELMSAIKLPLLAILRFQNRDDISEKHLIWLFAPDIRVTQETQAGTWRQLMGILNTLTTENTHQESIFSFRK